MLRYVLSAFVLFAAVTAGRADRIAPIAQPVERALRVPVVVVGKVTAIEKDTIDAPLYPGSPNKIAHKIAVVKIETNIAGADGTTHLKVGFVPSGTPGIRPGRGPENPELKEGQEWLFFLTKSPAGAFHIIPYMTPPVETKAKDFKEQLESVKKVVAVVADPAKALKAEKPAERYFAAIATIYKLRTLPEGTAGDKVENVSLTAEESRPILKALTESTWTESFDTMSGYRAFSMLGLTEADGWKPPAAEPGKNYPEVVRTAFAKWLDGPGKEYRIKKLVVKK
ncbi:MAG: hypothetical protein L0241_24725 [Planctomycetia bacterium]|nr:hypothetical protein [Planctomycetia bacterium]